jgi:hypothetical protein
MSAGYVSISEEYGKARPIERVEPYCNEGSWKEERRDQRKCLHRARVTSTRNCYFCIDRIVDLGDVRVKLLAQLVRIPVYSPSSCI